MICIFKRWTKRKHKSPLWMWDATRKTVRHCKPTKTTTTQSSSTRMTAKWTSYNCLPNGMKNVWENNWKIVITIITGAVFALSFSCTVQRTRREKKRLLKSHDIGNDRSGTIAENAKEKTRKKTTPEKEQQMITHQRDTTENGHKYRLSIYTISFFVPSAIESMDATLGFFQPSSYVSPLLRHCHQ